MDKEKFIFVVVTISAIYMYIICIKDFINKVINKLKVKTCIESIITVRIDSKRHFQGVGYNPGVNKLGSNPRFPDTYMIYCSDENDITYFINDEELFKSYDVGDMIKLKLIEMLDKNNEVISYEIKNLNCN